MAVVIMMMINDDNGYDDDGDSGDSGDDYSIIINDDNGYGDDGDDYSRVAWLQLAATTETQHCSSSVTVSV